MNAAETIAAAIDKLEALRAESDAPKMADGISARAYRGLELAVTLHRTIDAQLRILNGARGGAKDLDEGTTPDEPASTVDAIHLAEAILGES